MEVEADFIVKLDKWLLRYGQKVLLDKIDELSTELKHEEKFMFNLDKGRVQKKTDYLVTLIKRVGRYLAEITIS